MKQVNRVDSLLLVPGLMCDHAVWEPLLPSLSQSHACVVVDHGQADSLVTMAQQLLASAPPKFALAGHSMGARVALEVVRLAPERVQGVALLSTGYTARAPGPAGEEEARKRFMLLDLARTQGVRAMARVWVSGMVHPNRLDDQVLIDSILQMFERKTAVIFEQQIKALLNRPEASGVLSQLGVATLVMCGRQDSWASVAQHQAMHALVPSGVSELAIIENAGHMAPMEQPQAVAQALLQWLGRL